MEHERFEQIYKEGNPPWEHGTPDLNLERMLARFRIEPCRALDLGCGMGNNAIWLARAGFRVHGFDLSETAVENAMVRVAAAGVSCDFQVGDFLTDQVDGAPFGLVFDRGCLHCVPEPVDRVRFADNVAEVLDEGGFWLSLMGNADEPEREVGPPRMTARQIAEIVEPRFEILVLEAGLFGGHQDDPPRAWICLLKKR